MKLLTMLILSGMMAIGVVFMYAGESHAALTDGLVLCMPLDEGTGKIAKDASGNNFQGDLKGNAEWVAGKFGKALRFKASSDFVSIPTNKTLQISKTMSAGAWVNLDRLPNAHAIIIGTRNAGAAGRKIGFGYGMNPSNNIKVWTNDPNGNFLDINDTKTVLKPGQWYYLAFTHQSDKNGLVQIFVDGEMTFSQASNNPVDPSGTPNEVTIGAWTTETWTGIVDEVRIWNRVLSIDEIKDSMNKDVAKFVAVEPSGKSAGLWGKIKSSF